MTNFKMLTVQSCDEISALHARKKIQQNKIIKKERKKAGKANLPLHQKPLTAATTTTTTANEIV